MIRKRVPSQVYESPGHIGNYEILASGGGRLHPAATDGEVVDKWVRDHTLMEGKIGVEHINLVDDGVNRASVNIHRITSSSHDIEGMRYKIKVSIWDTPLGIPEGLLGLLDKGKFELTKD